MITYSFEKKPQFLTSSFKEQFKHLTKKIFDDHSKKLLRLHYHFCDDEYLLKINRETLNHDDYTDIITFDYTDNKGIMAEMFISIDRVEENAKLYYVDFVNELIRVMIHGILHCLGYNDKNFEDEYYMRAVEDKYIEYFFNTNVPRGT